MKVDKKKILGSAATVGAAAGGFMAGNFLSKEVLAKNLDEKKGAIVPLAIAAAAVVGHGMIKNEHVSNAILGAGMFFGLQGIQRAAKSSITVKGLGSETAGKVDDFLSKLIPDLGSAASVGSEYTDYQLIEDRDAASRMLNGGFDLSPVPNLMPATLAGGALETVLS